MSKLAGAAIMCGVLLLAVMATAALSAQALTTLHSFNGTDGSSPWSRLIQAGDGNLYGTTSAGGANGNGTAFKITTSGGMTTLHNFNHRLLSDGSKPYAGLIQARDGNLYGTTDAGGIGNLGTVFRMTTDGTLKTIHSFDYTHGAGPAAPVFQASSTAFYGATTNGGAHSAGMVYEITSFSQLIDLYDFCYNCADGAQPFAGLIQASDGNLYGMAPSGGIPDGCGTIFKVTLNGTLTLFHTFTNDGCQPWAALVEGTDGILYGTTRAGGRGYGNVFKITLSGDSTNLHTFCPSQMNCTDGANPLGALIQATDGNFYGTTQTGGAYNNGTIFRITPSGTLTTLYSFCAQHGCPDGSSPYAGLVQATDGNFYGTTESGGAHNDGTVFSFSIAP